MIRRLPSYYPIAALARDNLPFMTLDAIESRISQGTAGVKVDESR